MANLCTLRDPGSSISVASFLAAYHGPAPRLLGGAGGSERRISRANIYADDVILNWVSPGELLILTDQHFLSWDQARFSSFVENCEARDLSALAIKYDQPAPQIPDWFAAVSDRFAMPLLQIPYSTSVADFTSEVFRQIFEEQRAVLQRQDELMRSLQEALLQERGISGMLDILEADLHLPLAFLRSDDQQVLLRTADSSIAAEQLREDAQLSLSESFERKHSWCSESKLPGRSCCRLSVPVRNKKFHFGVLVSWSCGERPDRLLLAVMETVASSIALVILQEYAVREVEIKHSSEFLDELLSRPNHSHAMDRAAVYQLAVGDQVCAVLISIEKKGDPQEIFDVRRYLMSNMHWMQSTLHGEHLRGILAQLGNRIAAVITAHPGEDLEAVQKRLDHALRKILETTRSYFRHMELRIQCGVGRFQDGLAQTGKSFSEAESALTIGCRLFPDEPILLFDQIGIYRILTLPEVREEMQRFCEQELAALLEYDKRKGTELLFTLETYFANNANINKTSEELFTHYNTILYRLERIREITGKNLSDANERLNLELALRASRLYADDRRN